MSRRGAPGDRQKAKPRRKRLRPGLARRPNYSNNTGIHVQRPAALESSLLAGDRQMKHQCSWRRSSEDMPAIHPVTCDEHHHGPRASTICCPQNWLSPHSIRKSHAADPVQYRSTAASSLYRSSIVGSSNSRGSQYALKMMCTDIPSLFSSPLIATLCENGDQSG